MFSRYTYELLGAWSTQQIRCTIARKCSSSHKLVLSITQLLSCPPIDCIFNACTKLVFNWESLNTASAWFPSGFQVVGTMQRDWLKNSCHFFILSESKETTGSASLAVVFPRLPVSAMCFTLSFDWSTGLSLSSVSARMITLRLVLPLWFYALNIPRSIYQYSSMAPRLSGQNCKFFKFPLSLNSQKRLRYKENNTKYRGLT